MNRLEEMTRRRKEAHSKLIAAKSNVYKAFLIEASRMPAAQREENHETVETGSVRL